MAVQDTTDFRWNGQLSGAVNALYYDLVNVDVVHVPYSTDNRNSSFFLKTRLGYIVEEAWDSWKREGRDIKDLHIVRDSSSCDDENGTIYVLAFYGSKKKIFIATISDGCISGGFTSKSAWETTYVDNCSDEKLLVTDYVTGEMEDMEDMRVETGDEHAKHYSESNPGIQINKYKYGSAEGLFSDDNIESGYYDWDEDAMILTPGNYLLVYYSSNNDDSGFAGQVRMITGTDNTSGHKRIKVSSPWDGFKILDTSNISDGEDRFVQGRGLKYRVFEERGEVVGFTDKFGIHLIYDKDKNDTTEVYNSYGANGVISATSANDKIFVLTGNGYIHYNNTTGGYNKFFIQDDMFVGTDKISLTTYKDIIIAFGRRNIGVGIPDGENKFWTMYNQSNVQGIWSRYAFTEYDGDLLYVSSDRKLMSLAIADSGKYTLKAEDTWDYINSKLSTLLYTDDVFLGGDDYGLKIFVNTKYHPYDGIGDDIHSEKNDDGNGMSYIYKYDNLFKIWTEDYVDAFAICGLKDGIYFGDGGIYRRDVTGSDTGHPLKYGRDEDINNIYEFKSRISAYLIENENNGLDGHPSLSMLSKLNQIITTLGPGIYTDNTKIKITSYTKGIGVVYEFPLTGNKWLNVISKAYTGERVVPDDCLKEVVQDGQTEYREDHPYSDLSMQYLTPQTPWCDSYIEGNFKDYGVSVNTKLLRFAPTMPLVTSLGENQDYSTQIKIELISSNGDVICFGGWLAEIFIAPLGTTGPDGEYELSPKTEC